VLCCRSLTVGTRTGYKFYSLKSPQKLEKIYENCEIIRMLLHVLQFASNVSANNFHNCTGDIEFRQQLIPSYFCDVCKQVTSITFNSWLLSIDHNNMIMPHVLVHTVCASLHSVFQTYCLHLVSVQVYSEDLAIF